MIFLLYICSEVRIVDKITDLPVNYSKYLTNRRPVTVQSQPAPSPPVLQRQLSQPILSPSEPVRQYRSTTYNYPG